VRLVEVASGDQLDYQVVGPEETNPRGGKISHRSPVGRAILGKAAGDEVEVATPGGAVRYRIVSVD
jgi:transcription elongation GreA/GreB family factor